MAKTTDNSNTMNLSNTGGVKRRDRYEERRKRGLRKKIFLIPKFFAVFAIVFVAISIMLNHGDTVETYTAMKGSIEEYILADGFIFRNQEVITSPIGGFIECSASEGQRVNADTVIATVYNGEIDPVVTEKIGLLKKDIAKLEGSMTEAEVYATSPEKIELSIAGEAQTITQIREGSSFEDITAEKDTINNLIQKKQTVLGGGKSDEQRLTELKDELSSLENSITGSKSDIISPRAGVFSSRIDGYENALSLDMMADATPSYINNLKKESTNSSSSVAAGEPVCKVIDNYEWYFVGNIPEKDAANFEVGDSVRIKFYDLSDNVVAGTVKAISKVEGGKAAITVYSTKYIDSIYSTSKVSAELLTESAKGIKVPSGALRVIDGKQGVYVVRLGVARFIEVELLYNNKEWAVISRSSNSGSDLQLEMYDEVIVNTKGIEDGKVVRQ